MTLKPATMPPMTALESENVDESLRRALVAALYGTPKAILIASLVAVAFAGISFGLSGDAAFLVFASAFLAIGSARVASGVVFGRRDVTTLSAAGVRAWELNALAGAWAFSGVTGLAASYAVVVHNGTQAELLTTCCALGYIAGISSRNASRPLITVGQITAICVPLLASLVYQGDLVHLAIAAFILPLFLSTLVMAKSIHATIVQRHRAHAELERAALQDPLTGLKNRAALVERIERLLVARGPGEHAVALLVIDLDNFKSVNDGLGHLAGDALLRDAARRIRAAVGEEHEVSRIGGDEFLVVLSGTDKDQARCVADRIAEALARDFEHAGNVVPCGASIGIALGPRDGASYHELMTSADLALYEAKDEGRGRVVEFSASLRAAFEERRALERDLRSVLARGELHLAYQPVVDTRTRRVISCEALLRWDHPERGAISPASFIPIAEATGAIVPIGAWALGEACRQAASWPGDIGVAVNLSAVQFKSGGDLVATIRDALHRSGLAPSRLELEITESVLIENTAATLAIVDEIRRQGVRVALDDFGTGFSSLAYLSDFPFSKVKIDRRFSQGACSSAKTRSIIRSIGLLTSDLNMDLVAEGIETQDQVACLNELGISNMQGFLFSRPLPAADIRAWLDPARGARNATRPAA